MGLQSYEEGQCPGCGYPKAVAWHSEMDGWFDGHGVICHACTAAANGQEQAHHYAVDTRPTTAGPLPEFLIDKTTTTPSSN